MQLLQYPLIPGTSVFPQQPPWWCIALTEAGFVLKRESKNLFIDSQSTLFKGRLLTHAHLISFNRLDIASEQK